MPLTRAFLQASRDLPWLSPSENFSISWMVDYSEMVRLSAKALWYGNRTYLGHLDLG